jgi:hypothetical protein
LFFSYINGVGRSQRLFCLLLFAIKPMPEHRRSGQATIFTDSIISLGRQAQLAIMIAISAACENPECPF